jgi:hypothetical protein
MKIPFTIEQFLKVFKEYNSIVFPTQIFLYLLAFVAVYFSLKRSTVSAKVITAILSFFWLWMAIIYHLIFFTEINKAAYLFAILFVFQGLLFLFLGVLKNKFFFKLQFNIRGITGVALIIYSLIIYPILGYKFDHVYPSSPTFGLPCPTTIFTLGILLWTNLRQNLVILFIPLLWSIIGYSAAYYLHIYEDAGLIVSGFLVFTIAVIERKGIRNKQYKALYPH